MKYVVKFIYREETIVVPFEDEDPNVMEFIDGLMDPNTGDDPDELNNTDNLYEVYTGSGKLYRVKPTGEDERYTIEPVPGTYTLPEVD